MKSAKASRAPRRTSDALRIIDRMIGDDDDLRGMIEAETVNARVAMQIYKARSAAGLTQRRLAELVGTTQSVIARLEDADYRGHSLSMLNRVAAALGRRVEVKLVKAAGAR